MLHDSLLIGLHPFIKVPKQGNNTTLQEDKHNHLNQLR